MAGYVFAFSCPRDGAPLKHITSGGPSANETRAVAVCTDCGAEHVVVVTVLWGSPNPGRPTPAKLAQLARARERIGA